MSSNLIDPSQAFAGLMLVKTQTQTNKYDSDVSTADTIKLMQETVNKYRNSKVVEKAVDEAIRDLPPDASDTDTVRAIYYYVKRKITFCEDEILMKEALGIPELELDKELLIAPDLLLRMRTPLGDCDDFSVLIATMLSQLSFKVWFVTVAADEQVPWKFSHVYVKTYLDDKREYMYLDSSHGNYPGWQHFPWFRKEEWAI